MALDFTDGFTKLGRFGRILYLMNTGQAAMPAGYTSLFTEFAADLDTITGPVAQAEDGGIRGMSSLASAIQTAAQQYLLEFVKADVPTAAASVVDALDEFHRQMIAQSKTVNACAVSITPTAFSSVTGDGVLVTSTVTGPGLTREHMIAESARLTCVGDSYSGTATEGREPFRFVGEREEAGRFDYNWPVGSNASTNLNAISADVDADSGSNLLTNGDAEDWSTDATPELNNWVTADTWGTHLQRSATGHRGSYGLEFIAAANNTAIYQQFEQTDGTGTAADPVTLTSYAVNLFVRKVSGTITAGVLTVELVDDTGTVIDDEEGTANSFTIDLTAVTTTYVAYNGVFRLPAVKPSTVRLRLRMSTQLAGGNVLVDDACFARMTLAYPGGPVLAVFSGATPFLSGDGWDIVTTNDRGGASYGATWQTLFLRLFGQSSFLLPSDAGGTETQADTLITSA